MKRTPFQGPLWWRLALLCTFSLGTSSALLSENQHIDICIVKKSNFSTIVDPGLLRSHYNDDTHGKFVDFSAALEANNRSIIGVISTTNRLNRSFTKPLNPQKPSSFVQKYNLSPDSVVFDFTTLGISSKSYQCTLLIDSAFNTSFMTCCDQLYIGGKLTPQVSIRKNSTSMSLAHYPKSSFYEIYAVGEGIINASGSPGYFFVSPNVYFGHLPLHLVGPGPHKIYWLDADHIDEGGQIEEVRESSAVSIPEAGYPYFENGSESDYDFLGRSGSKNGALKIMRIDGKWVKVVKVK